MTSTATAIYPDPTSTRSIVRALVKLCIPGFTGPEHLILVADTSQYEKDALYCKRRAIKGALTYISIPYRLEFLLAQRTQSGLVCFWWYDTLVNDSEAKEWYDRNALEGRFPLADEEK